MVAYETQASGKLGNISLYRLEGGKVIESTGRFHVDMSDRLNYEFEDDWKYLGTHTRIGSLLSQDETNSKLIKSALNTDALSYIYYGAPAKLSGFHMCSHMTKECEELCLNTSGNGRYHSNQIYRMARTRFEVYRPESFWKLFREEIETAKRRLKKSGKSFLAIRPNGTTDRWSDYLDYVVGRNPDVRWYDYTAVPSRLAIADMFHNYDVTLSRKETKRNHEWLRSEGYGKRNVAVVCTKSVKTELMEAGSLEGIGIVDFDKHDLRLPEYDGSGIIGLLTPKGKARGVESGFIVSSVDQLRKEIRGAS
jgi:hypothetical protein